MLDNVRVCPSESPSHDFYVFVNLFPYDLGLFLPVNCDSYAEILDCLDALNTPNLWEVFLGKDLRLFFVKP